ncbi:MAG: hypothetical protein IH944_08340 [Armatimonadetes bacterium]|nr:hypothetical protein [Armatimonadota bacterium]
MEFFRKRWPCVLLVLLPVLPLWRSILLGEAIGPFDNIRAMMAGMPTPEAWDVLQADAALQFYVWRDLVFEAWRNLEPPFWNQYQLMGTPLLANSQSGGFYPLHILIGLLHIPTAFGITLLAWFHLAFAGLGSRKLSLALGASETGAVAGGCLLVLSPFLLSWVGLASVLTTVAWLPWALYFAIALMRAKNRARDCACLAGCVAMMILGGHLQFAAYGVIGVACVIGWSAVSLRRDRKTVRSAGVAVLAIALGGMLAAPQLLPVLEYGKFSHRKGVATRDGYQGYVSTSIKPFELVGSVTPMLLGEPGQALDGVDSVAPIGTYWPAYVKRGANYAETSSIYFGPVLLLLVLGAVARFKGRLPGGIALVGFVGALLAFGTPLNRLLYFYFPGWSATGSPGRAGVLLIVAMCALAALGWPDEAANRKVDYRRAGIVALLAVLAVVVSAVGLSSLPAWAPEYEGLAALAQSQALLAAAPKIVIALGLMFAIAALGASNRYRYVALGCLVLSQLVIGGWRLIPTSPNPWEAGEPDPNTRIAFINQNWGLNTGWPVTMPPNVAAGLRLYDMGGYDSLLHRDTVAHLREINGQDPAPQANGNIMFIKPDYDRGLLALSGVTEIWSLSSFQFNSGATVEKELLDGPGRANVGERAASIDIDTASGQVVGALGPGTLIVRDRYMPGWSAKVDGESVDLPPGLWREVEIGPGEHTVVFSYVPPGLKRGLALAGFALLALLFMVIWRARCPQDQSRPPQ